jgi:mRNA interferase YafQ
MYEVHRNKKFRKSYKRLRRSGSFDVARFEKVVTLLVRVQELPDFYHDHSLQGNLSNTRECHLEGDCMLEYEYDHVDKVLYLIDIGNHANVFGM